MAANDLTSGEARRILTMRQLLPLAHTRLHPNSLVCTMASPIIRMQTRRLGSQLRSFSTSPRQFAPVNKLGVIGSGQMVSSRS